jgi:hypothetical protein
MSIVSFEGDLSTVFDGRSEDVSLLGPPVAQRFAVLPSACPSTGARAWSWSVGNPWSDRLGMPPTYGNGENYGYQTFTLSATQT